MREARALLFAVLVLLAAPAARGLELYVAPGGDDDASGKKSAAKAGEADGPLASLEGARNAIRRLREGGLDERVDVLIRGGEYLLERPFVLEPIDSGTPEKPVRYAAYKKERPIFLGARPLEFKAGADGRWRAAFPGAAPGRSATQLFIDGERRIRARTPNEGFFHVAARAADPIEDPRNNRGFFFREGDIRDWGDPEANVLVVHSWETSRHRIASVDPAARLVQFTGPATWPFTQWDKEQRYTVEGMEEALDAPGEWHYARERGEIVYLPLPGERPERVRGYSPLLPQFFVLKGNPEESKFVTDVRIEGLRFEYSSWELPDEGYSDSQAAHSIRGAAELRGARRVVIADCEIAHAGTYGLRILAGSRDVEIERNHLHDLGAGGVGIGEKAIRREPNMNVTHCRLVNNILRDGGHVYESGVGVWIGQSSDNTVAHNEIADFGYTGVSVGWTWGYGDSAAQRNIIEHNHIHHIGTGTLSDMGAIYTLGESAGSVLRGNHIHHVTAHHYGGWGIYPDEGTSHLLVEGNLVHDTKTGGFHQHYGKENFVRNNIFANARIEQVIRTRVEEHRSFRFEQNIVYFTQGELLGSNWDGDHFFMDRNVYWRAGSGDVTFKGKTFEEWRKDKDMDWASAVADPRFADAEAGDFRLRKNSPALALGFEPIDAGRAGLIGSRAWRNLPKKFTKHRQVWPPPEAHGK